MCCVSLHSSRLPKNYIDQLFHFYSFVCYFFYAISTRLWLFSTVLLDELEIFYSTPETKTQQTLLEKSPRYSLLLLIFTNVDQIRRHHLMCTLRRTFRFPPFPLLVLMLYVRGRVMMMGRKKGWISDEIGMKIGCCCWCAMRVGGMDGEERRSEFPEKRKYPKRKLWTFLSFWWAWWWSI